MNKMLHCVLSLTLLAGPLLADDAASAAATTQESEMAKMKAQLAEQQRQIEKLTKILESMMGTAAAPPAAPGAPAVTPSSTLGSLFPSTGSLASTAPMVPPPPMNTLPAAATSAPLNAPRAAQAGGGSGNPCESAYDVNAPYLRIGSACVTPVGFMDMTSVWRDKTAASGIGSNFGSVPYNNAALGNLSEFHFSPQNSRIGFRVDGMWNGAHFIGYNEFDFLGTNPSTNLTVTNGAFMPRLRLFWLDVRKGNWEVMGGQSWSMLTPNRSGISPLPGDIFYSQTIDVNYMAGLTWTRQPGIRVVYHTNDNKVAIGFAAENPDQYVGGSGGAGSIALPAALSIAGAGGGSTIQFDNANNIGTANPALAAPNLLPDLILKLAFDPNNRFHFEVAGIARTFQDFNPNTTGLGAQQHFKTEGAGLQFGFNAALTPNFRFITTNYLSDGGGRYLFGQAPDLVVHSDGSISGIHADGTVDGFEYKATKNLLLYAYYGGIYIGRQALLDANGTTKIGYGYTGSANSQNRAVQEVTFGFNQTLWSSPKYGAVNFMGQYMYLDRSPWFVAVGAPKAAHDNTIYFNLRYSLPGTGAQAIKY